MTAAPRSRRRTLRPWNGAVAGLAATAALLPALLPAGPLRADAPWWEQYEHKDSYLCPKQGVLVLERNEDQASLRSGRHRSTLFREPSDSPDLRYRSGRMLLILRGDELTLEELPQRLICLRTEQV